MKNWHELPSGYTGRLLEEELFGELSRELAEKKFYMPYKEAMEDVRQRCSWDASEPPQRFASDLHATVADRLQLEDYAKLRFYSAVGSALDHYHGVDAFLELEKDSGEVVRITLDVTEDPHKEQCKADVLISLPGGALDPIEDKKQYGDLLSYLTDEITRKIDKKGQKYQSRSL